MRRLGWIILTLWGLSSLLLWLALSPLWSIPCQRPALVVYGNAAYQTGRIVDMRTGVYIETGFRTNRTLSPNGAYYYAVPDLPTIHNNITLFTTATNQSRILYRTNNELAIKWAADSQSLYILEVTSQNRRGRETQRFVRVHVETGEILRDYPLPNSIYLISSPDRHYLYFTVLNEAGEEQLAAINTITGEMSDFRFSPALPITSWSPDQEWIVLGDAGELFVVDAVTGAAHPQITMIQGYAPYWTDNSIWFQAEQDNEAGTSYWRASLSDGSIQLEYENATVFAISDDDHWRYLAVHDNEGSSTYLHDRHIDGYIPFQIDNPLFSSDGLCLMGFREQIPTSSEAELMIYDLETMQLLGVNSLDTISNVDIIGFRWYERE